MDRSREARVGGSRRHRRSRRAALSLAVLVAASHPALAAGEDADDPPVVANPGPFTASVLDAVIDVGSPAAPRPLLLRYPDCPRAPSIERCLVLTGEVATDGTVVVPPGGVDVPTGRVTVDLSDVVPGLTTDLLVDLQLPEGLTGHLDPGSGLMTWEGPLEVDLSDDAGILADGCGVRGAELAMSSAGYSSLPMPPFFPAGRAYDPEDGTVRLVDNRLALPGASGCGSLGSIDLDALIDREVPLPAAAASFRLELQLDPVLLPASADPTDPTDPTDPVDPTDPADPPAPFRDVEGSVHAANIRTLQLQGIVQGVTADRYEPRAPVRRGQLASMLARMLRLDPVATGPFTDVAGSVHEGSINALAAAGIALGTGLEGRFEPNALIRRDQVAALIGRALEVEPVSSGPFRDVVGNTHEGWIDALAEAGVVRGFAPDRFGPRDDVRRDAVASMLARALDQPG
jgi:hypothetical protein